MERISQNNPLRKSLVKLIHSIEKEIGLEEESIVLLLHLLDSEEKIYKFNEWVKTKLKGDKIQATEVEICGAASLISKNIPVN